MDYRLSGLGFRDCRLPGLGINGESHAREKKRRNGKHKEGKKHPCLHSPVETSPTPDIGIIFGIMEKKLEIIGILGII